MKRSIILTLTIVLLVATSLCAQRNDTIRWVEFTGKVISIDDGKPVQFANIVKTTERQGTITDTLGFFTIKIHPGELVKISAVGYNTEFIYLKESMLLGNSFFMEVKMQTEYYKIAAINIYDVRWQEFKQKVLEADLPDDGKKVIEKWIKEELTEEFMSGLRAKTPGITINLQSKYDKQRIYVARLEREKSDQRRAIDKVYYLAGRYTGYSGTELMHFVNFCNFAAPYVLNTNDYDITMRIKRYHSAYVRRDN